MTANDRYTSRLLALVHKKIESQKTDLNTQIDKRIGTVGSGLQDAVDTVSDDLADHVALDINTAHSGPINETTHGDLAGGSLHAEATDTEAGFVPPADGDLDDVLTIVAPGVWAPRPPTGGGGGGSLTVEDGTTSVASVVTIVFDGATVTDDTGGQVTVTVSGGGSPVIQTSIWDAIYDTLSILNTDPIDAIIEQDDFVAFVYLGSNTTNAWQAASNSYAVPTGKKLTILSVHGAGIMPGDDSNRKMRLRNTTDSTDVVDYNAFLEARGIFPWVGDLSNPSRFPDASASKTVQLEVWNSDSQKRAMGGVVVARVVPASGSYTPATRIASSSDAAFVLGQVADGLTNQIVIPKFLESADAAPASPSAVDDEFPGSTLDAKWAWVNQGSATATVSGSHLKLSVPSGAGSSARILYQGVSGTWVVTTHIAHLSNLNNYAYCGVALRESGTSKLVMFLITAETGVPKLQVHYWTNETSFSSVPASQICPTGFKAYLRITDDGTNLTLEVSHDGIVWFTWWAASRTAWFSSGPNQVGYVVDVNGSGGIVTLASDFIRKT